MLIGRVARGGSEELNLGDTKRRRNIVHSEQKNSTEFTFTCHPLVLLGCRVYRIENLVA